MVTNSSTLRPILFNVDGLNGGTISHLSMHNPPNCKFHISFLTKTTVNSDSGFNLIQNSKDLVVSDLNLTVKASGANPAKNTDGFDTYRSSNIVIQNTRVDNTDDCVSFKPNSTSVLVQNMWCNGSHGISVGSLGQYVGVTDIVEDVYIYNISMNNAGDGARIKVFPGAPDNVTLNAGGGSGYVKNVTYDTLSVNNVDWAIEVTGCYTVTAAACALRPPKFSISDVLFKDFSGVTSTKYSPDVATLACPDVDACTNIKVQNFTVKSPAGTNAVLCSNVGRSVALVE
jgi:galacturan 1,4-alpha-galacturonidase